MEDESINSGALMLCESGATLLALLLDSCYLYNPLYSHYHSTAPRSVQTRGGAGNMEEGGDKRRELQSERSGSSVTSQTARFKQRSHRAADALGDCLV